MKRILPVVIFLCILGSVLTCLPKNNETKQVVSSLDDVNNCKVGIQSGTNYEVYLADACPGAEAVFFNDFSSIYPALDQGKIDVMLTESMSYAVEKMEIPTLKKVDDPIMTLDYSIGVSQNEIGKKVYSQLNEFIDKAREDGTIDMLTDYWIESYDRENSTVDKSGITGENGVLPMAMEASFEPMCFAGKGAELIGYNVDLMYRFCREYGYEPKIEPLAYDAMTAALSSGKITLGVGMIPDDERSESVLFTNSVFDFDIIVAFEEGTGVSENVFKKLCTSFEKTFIRDSRWMMFVQGAITTLLISALSVIFGTIFGLLLYQWCMHGKKAERTVVSVLCWLMSSTPTAVLLMIFYYVFFGSYAISNVAVAVIGFSLLFSCGFYERIVAGIKAVGTGQEEAARAQGFSKNQAFFKILFPQAAEHFMPSFQGDVIALIQNTSVVGYIAVMDLTKMSDLVRGRTFEAFFPLLSTAAIYFIIIWIMTAVLRRLSFRLNYKNRNSEKVLKRAMGAEEEEDK